MTSDILLSPARAAKLERARRYVSKKREGKEGRVLILPTLNCPHLRMGEKKVHETTNKPIKTPSPPPPPPLPPPPPPPPLLPTPPPPPPPPPSPSLWNYGFLEMPRYADRDGWTRSMSWKESDRFDTKKVSMVQRKPLTDPAGVYQATEDEEIIVSFSIEEFPQWSASFASQTDE